MTFTMGLVHFLYFFCLHTNLVCTEKLQNYYNPNFDLLTGILHHSQYTKTCGSTLQTLGFENFWNNKFDVYTKKATRLASALSHLIAEYNEEDEYLKRIDGSLLSSYNYFVFSNGELESTSKKQHSTSIVNNNKEIKSKDKFIISYGVIFQDNNDRRKKCIYINDNTQTSDSCSFFESTNQNPSLKKKQKQQSVEEDTIKLSNCNFWYKNFYKIYEKTVKNPTIVNYNHSFNQRPDYDTFLNKLLQDKEFANSQWCGPFYECIVNQTFNWVLIYTIPLIGLNNEFKGALLFKLNLTNLDINQCDDITDLFSNTHKCKRNTKCVYKPNNGFKLGGYSCRCIENENIQDVKIYNGIDVENEYWLLKNMKKSIYNESFNCIECEYYDCCKLMNGFGNESRILRSGKNEYYFKNCKHMYNRNLRKILLVIQTIMIFISVLIAIAIYRFRKTKV
jgi:hypothetical protein